MESLALWEEFRIPSMNMESENIVCHEILNYLYRVLLLFLDSEKESHIGRSSLKMLHGLSRIL